MVNEDMILTKKNVVIPRSRFEASLCEKINAFSDEKKEVYFGRTLSFLNLAPFNSDISLDYTKPEEMLDLKRVLYAQKANNLAITNWLASKGLETIFGVTKPITKLSSEDNFVAIHIQNKYALFKHALDKGFFNKKISTYFDLPKEVKSKKKFYHLINEATSVVDGLQQIQSHFRGGEKLNGSLLARLKNEAVNLKLYRPNPLPRQVERAYFLIIKEKEPSSIAEKLSLKLAELDIVSQQVPSFDLGGASIKDYFGFSINTQEHIDMAVCHSYEESTINRLKKFYANHEYIHHRYLSKQDNFYRGDSREMKGIQMYLMPNEFAVAEGGLVLPFPDVAGSPEHFKNIFPVSFHAQDAKAYAEAQIGGYGVKPHMQYKDEEHAKIRNFIKSLSPQVKKSYMRNLSVLEDVNDLESVYVAFELGNGL
jgi:hypothetical protein